MEQVQVLDGQRRAIEKELEVIVDALAVVRAVLSMPNMGIRSASTLLGSAWRELERHDANALRRVSGQAPVSVLSGKQQDQRGPRRPPRVQMRRASRAALRDGMFNWTSVVVMHDAFYKAKYQQLRDRGCNHPRALRSVGDHLLRVLSACIKQAGTYDSARLATKLPAAGASSSN